MKQLIKSMMPAPIRDFLIWIYKFYPYRPSSTFPSQEGAFATLKALGWSPKTCIDVGAYDGRWATMFRNIFPDSKVLMIEGQVGKKDFLEKTAASASDKLSYEIAVLGANEGQEVSFVEMESGSSVFEETSSYPRTKRIVKLTKLDNLLKLHPEFIHSSAIKLDTQGYELEILKGAHDLLKHLEVILLEVSLIQINKGAPLFAEIINFLTANQFILFDFCSQIRRKDGVLWQTDLMFIRDGAIPNLEPRLTINNWG